MESPEDPITIRFQEGTRTFRRRHAPKPSALWESLRHSETSALLFDFDSARVTHANASLERTLAISAAELRQCTGRMLTPASCDALTDVISKQLHGHSGYVGPGALRHGDLGHLSLNLNIEIVSHHGYRYGIDIIHPLTLPRTAERSLLIVDDEPIVLRTIKRVCARFVPVRTATDTYSAIQLITSDPSISAVLSDIDMPGPSGIKLLEACQQFQPDLANRFILYSGRADRPLSYPGVPFLPKPVPLPLLRQTIERVMAR